MSAYLLFRSVTYAYRAVLVLQRAGIPAQIVRTREGMSSHGCSHALRLAERFLQAALRALETSGMDWERVFRVYPDGRFAEVEV